MQLAKKQNLPLTGLIKQIKSIVAASRQKIAQTVNEALLHAYWEIGKHIVEFEQKGNIRAEYGKSLIIQLSKELTKTLGKGFSRSNLKNMRNFYLYYQKGQTLSGFFEMRVLKSKKSQTPSGKSMIQKDKENQKFQTLSGKLSWSHYCEFLLISDNDKRSFYEKECINSNWSVRELKRQIDSSLFERLLLSDGKANKEKVVKLAQEGQTLQNSADLIKDPYVFEFLGIPENKPLLEKDLEYKLIIHIEKFLLELGRGFMFVGSQQRITLNNKHHYIDMVFYNKIIKAYILIDLKIRKLKPDDIGKMNTYLNYYKTEINESSDNEPVGIILCAEKDEVVAEYALGGLTNQIFASKYVYYLPDKELLIKQVEKVLKENK